MKVMKNRSGLIMTQNFNTILFGTDKMVITVFFTTYGK